jgi:hypothetical protein
MSAAAPQASPRPMTLPAPQRVDAWWLGPLVTGVVLAAFVVYATWAGLQNAHYYAAPYLSPLYSPCLSANCAHVSVPILGSWWKWSPAILVLWAPGGFRLTCYYYRKAYYRAFVWAPAACAIPDAPKRYWGESRFPLILQNIHRYFFYASVPILLFLWWDVIKAFQFADGFGVGIGTLVLAVNASLLTLYTLSCHSCRHVCGGRLDRFSQSPRQHRLWKALTSLNEWHMQIAWVSLFGVALTDLYVRLVAMGAIRDLRFF